MAETASAATEEANRENSEGVIELKQDVIFLNGKVILSEETPLLTEAQDVAGAINELKNSLAEGGGDELWQPPGDWLEVPEPGAWEANFLIEFLTEDNLTFQFYFRDPMFLFAGAGVISIDWGDENIDVFSGGELDDNGNVSGGSWDASGLKHTYSAAGQYVIKVTTDQFNCVLDSFGNSDLKVVLIAKLGENIRLETYESSSKTAGGGGFGGCYRLHFVSLNGSSRLPRYCFSPCYSLKRIDFTNKLTEIPYSCFNIYNTFNFSQIDFSEVIKIDTYGFNYSYSLEKISLPKCTEIANGAFTGCCGLAEISAPLCASVGNYAFQNCYALEKTEFAENCTFGTNAFQNCYNLYPRPDGSTN